MIVVGSGMGGLSAASFLAQQGSRVLVLEQNSIVGGCTQSYERRGYRFNIGLHYVGSVQGPTVTRRLFDAATEGAVRWHALPSVYNRMVLGERSYDIPAGRDAYRAALAERFPMEVQAIDRYLDLVVSVNRTSRGYFAQKALPEELVADSYDEWTADFHHHSDRLTIDALRELTDDRELIGVWTANWGDYSLPPSRSSFAMHCMLNRHYLDGGSYPVGGPMALATAIAPIVERAGGRILHSADVGRIVVEGGRAVGVELRSGEVARATAVVSNAGVRNTFGRLLDTETAAASGVANLVDEVGDSYALVGLNLGLRASAADLGITPANIWAHDTNDFDANLSRHRDDFDAPFGFHFITFPSAKDPDWETQRPNTATVEMYAWTDFAHFQKWEGVARAARGDDFDRRKEAIRVRLLAELERYVPGVSEVVDVAEVSTPLTYERFLRRRRGGFMGLEASPERFRARWLRAPTALPGLYLSGQDVTTDGIIGALTGGLAAASAVAGEDLMSAAVTRSS